MKAYSKLIQPIAYTKIEGGLWRDWPKEIELKKEHLEKRSTFRIQIGGLFVHSLAFKGDPRNGHKYERWDCANGWTRGGKS